MFSLGNRYPCLRKIVINTKTDRAFRGVLWQRKAGYLVLRNAELIKAHGETLPLDGEVMIEAANIDFIQVL